MNKYKLWHGLFIGSIVTMIASIILGAALAAILPPVVTVIFLILMIGSVILLIVAIKQRDKYCNSYGKRLQKPQIEKVYGRMMTNRKGSFSFNAVYELKCSHCHHLVRKAHSFPLSDIATFMERTKEYAKKKWGTDEVLSYDLSHIILNWKGALYNYEITYVLDRITDKAIVRAMDEDMALFIFASNHPTAKVISCLIALR